MKGFYAHENYAERAVLGCLLINNSSWHEIGDYLQASDFSTAFFREIYCSIERLLTESKEADVICVSQHLVSDNKVNGDPFAQLCEIINSQFTPANIKHYAEIVKQKSLDRRMIAVAQNMIVSVREQQEDRLSVVSLSKLSNALPLHFNHII